MKVGILYSEKEVDNELEHRINPHGSIQMDVTLESIKNALENRGHETTLIPAVINLPTKLRELSDLDIIFNLSTGITKKSQQAHVVSILEMMSIPFLGSGLSSQVLSLEKHVAKKIFDYEGIPTPKFQVFYTGEEKLREDLNFPLILKPVHEGSSMGITEDSIVTDEESFKIRVSEIISDFKQAAMVEEFIVGREFTVGIMGNDKLEVLPIEEIVFDHRDTKKLGVMTLDIKTRDAIVPKTPADIPKEKAEEIVTYAKKIFRVLGCRDFARIDLRMDNQGVPYFLEVNALPGLQPEYSEFPRMAAAAGYMYDELIEKLMFIALDRYKTKNKYI